MEILLRPELVEGKRRTIDDRLSQSIAATVDRTAKLVVALDVPADAVTHQSLLHAMSDAYSLHRRISFAPHDLWYVLVSELARMINARPGHYRALFTRSAEKIEILVPDCDGPMSLPLELVLEQLRALVPVDLDLWLPEFTTHTDRSRVACMAAFADAVKSYYAFGIFACGLPAVDVRGTFDDWQLFGENLQAIRKLMHADWLQPVIARIWQIRDSVAGGDRAFYTDLFRQHNIGSGGQLAVDGWFAREFFAPDAARSDMLDEFPVTWSIVPFTNVSTGRRFSEVYGCFHSAVFDGYYRPDYGHLTIEHA